MCSKIDDQGKKALLTVLTIVLLITALMIIVGCQKVQSLDDDIPELIEEVAIDVVEVIADDVIEEVIGVDPNLDFNGNNDTDKSDN